MRRSILVLSGALFILGPTSAGATPYDGQGHAQLTALRLPFIANEGQVDARVAFSAPGPDGTVFVTRTGELVYSLPAPASGTARERRARGPRPGWALTETLRGARVRPTGQDPSATGVSYFLGNDPARWRPSVATYEQLGLGEVWPGIRVALRAHGRGVEKIFTVDPGASPARIRVRVDGATALVTGPDGALVARTGLGPVTLTAPIAYQERAGVRRPVAVAYRLEGREYGFTVASYDPTLPLVIDPLVQSTYLGGSGADFASGLRIHPATGDVYVAGYTESNNFPQTSGGPQPTIGGGGVDAFVARLNGSLTTVMQATYLGGSSSDFAVGLAIHPTTGDVYVIGETGSPNFPHTLGGAQPTFGGQQDAFVARFTSTLTSLTQATYLGGSGFEEVNTLVIHPTTGDVYVAGGTTSTNFPGTAGGAQPMPAGGFDGFVSRLTATLGTIVQSTYLGGGVYDEPFGLAIHPNGSVYVSGDTTSANFPGTAGGAQPAFGGERDGFVARLNAGLTVLTQSTYIGGSKADVALALAVHPTNGDVYVAGYTSSTNFPGTAGGAQPAYGGGMDDVFVARLSSGLNSIGQATYLGGSADDGVGIGVLAIHPATGDVYVAGGTGSANFPGTSGGAQSSYGGGAGDGFIARLTSTLTSVIQATFLGGSGNESVAGLAFHPTTGDVYVGGGTNSANFPGTSGGAQPISGGSDDAFVTRLTFGLAQTDPRLSLTANVNQTSFVVGQTLTTSAAAVDPGILGVADFCLGALLPDGVTIVFWTGPGNTTLGRLNDLRTFRCYASGVALGTPFVTNLPAFLSRQWTTGDPRGTYVLFHLAMKAGLLATGAATNDDILGLVTTAFTFP